MMQYDNYHDICTQGTQTKLSTSSKDDVLVSFTSTCSLLSSTFSQFMLELSRILHLPVDGEKPLISVDRLLSEFKARSLELNNIDRTELSFHSPLLVSPSPTSPDHCVTSPREVFQAELQKLDQQQMEGILDSTSTSPSRPQTNSPSNSPFRLTCPPPQPLTTSPNKTPPPIMDASQSSLPGTKAAPPSSLSSSGTESAHLPKSASHLYLSNAGSLSSLNGLKFPPVSSVIDVIKTTAVTSQDNSDILHLSSSSSPSPHRIPVMPVPAKITKEHADSTNRISPPLPLNETSIGMSGRSAFCKPLPKQASPTLGQSGAEQIKLEPSTPPANTKSEIELLECLQKLQNCCEKYKVPPSLPFSLNSLLPGLRARSLSSPKSAAVTPSLLKTLDNLKCPSMEELRNAAQLENLKAASHLEALKSTPLDSLKTAQFEGLKLPLPTTFQFLGRAGTDPNLIIKAMQESNPLLNTTTHIPDSDRHQISPMFNSPMKCPHCDLTFHKKSHLSNHLVQLHSHSYHCCRQCKISFPDRLSLEHHQRSHPKQQFQCTGCNLSFKTGSELKRHVKTHTQERAFMCDICGSRFNLKHNLKAHMRQHTGERPFRCKICNRGFTRSNNLKRHYHAHCSAAENSAQQVGRSAVLASSDQILSMIPNMMMFENSTRLPSVPMPGEVRVD